MEHNPDRRDEEFELRFPQANISPVKALGRIIRKTIGPQTTDVMVFNHPESNIEGDPLSPVDADIIVTNDGATLLEELPIEHPVAPILARLAGPKQPGDSDIEGSQITDGISTSVALTEALLVEAESLIEQGVHPKDIELGYALARERVVELLNEWSISRDRSERWEAELHAVARTAMTGNRIGGNLSTWAEYAVEAHDLIGYPTPETFVTREIRDGHLNESRLVRGAVLDRSEPTHDEMPSKVTDANVAVFSGTKQGGLTVQDVPNNWRTTLDSVADLRKFEDAEQKRRLNMVEQLQSYDVDVVVAQQGIDAEYQSLLADKGILGIRGVTKLDLSQVSLATGATKVLKTDALSRSDIGHAGVVSVEQIEPRKNRRSNRRMVVFDDCPDPGSVTMLFRGVTSHLGPQASTSVRKAVAATAAASGASGHTSGMIPGGANPEIRVSEELQTAALELDNRVQLAIQGYADAVERMVRTLVENAGLDPFEMLPDLKATIATESDSAGILLPSGRITSMRSEGVVDPVSVRIDAYKKATEVASLVISIDDAIDAELSDDGLSKGDAIYDDVAERHEDNSTD